MCYHNAINRVAINEKKGMKDMGQVLVRDVASEIMDKLKARAERHHRSLEAELRVIFSEAVDEPSVDVFAEIERIRSLFRGRTFEDSATLLGEDRER